MFVRLQATLPIFQQGHLTYTPHLEALQDQSVSLGQGNQGAFPLTPSLVIEKAACYQNALLPVPEQSISWTPDGLLIPLHLLRHCLAQDRYEQDGSAALDLAISHHRLESSSEADQ